MCLFVRLVCADLVCYACSYDSHCACFVLLLVLLFRVVAFLLLFHFDMLCVMCCVVFRSVFVSFVCIVLVCCS